MWKCEAGEQTLLLLTTYKAFQAIGQDTGSEAWIKRELIKGFAISYLLPGWQHRNRQDPSLSALVATQLSLLDLILDPQDHLLIADTSPALDKQNMVLEHRLTRTTPSVSKVFTFSFNRAPSCRTDKVSGNQEGIYTYLTACQTQDLTVVESRGGRI